MRSNASSGPVLCGIAVACVLGGFAAESNAVADPAAQDTLALIAPIAGEGIIEQLDALEANWPIRDSDLAKSDPEYAAVFTAQENLCMLTKMKLIGDLWRSEPTHDRLAELMPYRWENVRRIRGLNIEPEVARFAELFPDETKAIQDGWYTVAEESILASRTNFDAATEHANAYIARYPDDDRCASLLTTAARSTRDEQQKSAVMDRILRE